MRKLLKNLPGVCAGRKFRYFRIAARRNRDANKRARSISRISVFSCPESNLATKNAAMGLRLLEKTVMKTFAMSLGGAVSGAALVGLLFLFWILGLPGLSVLFRWSAH